MLAESYPGNWFDERMLATRMYYGIEREGVLASMAGIHVYSATWRVAALGNVTTHPAWRGQGLASRTCARLVQELLDTAEIIGLNVKADNGGAINCYEKLGFRFRTHYEEWQLGSTC